VANLTNLVALQNEIVPAALELAKMRIKVDRLRQFVHFGEGPASQVAVVESVQVGAPAAATVADRAAMMTVTRANDVLTKTTAYTPFRTWSQLTWPEINKLIENNALLDEMASGLVRCWGAVLARVRAIITGSVATETIPDIGGGTDFLAATHTNIDATTYANLGTPALTTASFQDGVDAMTLEQDWTGEFTNAEPNVLISSSAQKNHAIVKSAYGSSALDANIGEGMGQVVLPGLGDFWALSTGPSRKSIRVDFRKKGAAGDPGGLPYVLPAREEQGQVFIEYGADFAGYALTHIGLWISNGTT
jgi:hypothetical protein